MEIMPFGGQFKPNSTVGAAALSKKAQKKLKKKKISLRMKPSIANRKPISNLCV